MRHRETGISCAVILSTYNSPGLLELALAGYAAQSTRRFELLVADDGSGPETRRVIEAAAGHGLHIDHVWHPDEGFRKCAILNRAIERARGEYLIFSDGDCIPAPDFVATHLAHARPGRFLSGGCLRLSQATSKRVQVQEVLAGRATRYGALRSHGMAPGLLTWLRMGSFPALAAAADFVTPTRASWNGHNSSCWREAAIRVNGFDERMGYGGEDREFGERLVRAGVVPIQVRHRARCVHLDHDRDYVRADVWAANDTIRAENRKRRVVFSEVGIEQGPGAQ